MEILHVVCPHCGLKMEVEMQGKPSSMMVFVCSRCKEPLMRYEGEIVELDRQEFSNLRKKLEPVISKLLQVNENPEQKKKPDTEIELKETHKSKITDASLEALEKALECPDVLEFINKI